MTREDFERLLTKAVEQLGHEVRANNRYHKPDDFETRVFEVLKDVARGEQIEINPSFHPHAFPDIKANGFGVEVKTTIKDSWLSVGNSVFEGMRDRSVRYIYVVFGKMGGMPSVRWGRYEERITHVRISHAPRFVIEMDRDSPLFDHMQVEYDAFSAFPPEEKMRHIRRYSRSRLKPGEKLWWLEDEQGEGLPVEVRFYTGLADDDKIRLRAEVALLCPEIMQPGTVRGKYENAAFYLLSFHGVLVSQVRDLFTAGSVALRQSSARGGNYMQRSLIDIQEAIADAAGRLDAALFQEYWNEEDIPENPRDRIRRWLELADAYARDWRPSTNLFVEVE